MSTQLQPNQSSWQHYMVERDELFLRSRSISVTEMATTLAHELNQPLGSVTNILHGLKHLLAAGDMDTDRCNDAIELALQQTRFAARVISRIRDFTESRQPEFVQFNVVDLLNQSVRLLDWVFSTDSVRVVLKDTTPILTVQSDLPDNSPTELLVTGDYTMIQQVFTNLLRNASDALREIHDRQRVIRVTVGRVDSGIKVEIRDNGQGLNGISASNLFKPFLSSKQNGMGVGLSICQSFIELHQGKLWVTPNQGSGCTAHVLLRTASGVDDE